MTTLIFESIHFTSTLFGGSEIWKYSYGGRLVFLLLAILSLKCRRFLKYNITLVKTITTAIKPKAAATGMVGKGCCSSGFNVAVPVTGFDVDGCSLTLSLPKGSISLYAKKLA
jgi:hypothetical protein